MMLSIRYKQTQNTNDLAEALSRVEMAVSIIPEDHVSRPAMLDNLGSMLSDKYDRTGNIEDLQAAISRAELAVSTTPEDNPIRAQ